MQEAVEDEAAELGCVGDTVFTRLGARPVAGDIDLAQQVRLAGQMSFVAIERDDVGRAVAFKEPAIQFVYPSVGNKYHVDGGSVRLEVSGEKSAEAPDVGAQAVVLRAVDAGLQCSVAQLEVGR